MLLFYLELGECQSCHPSAAGPFCADLAADHVPAHRYHSSKLIRTMNHYRIGRVEGSWVNFTPPIRGGLFAQSTKDCPTGIPQDPISIHAEQLSQFFSSTSPTLELELQDDSPGSRADAVPDPLRSIDNTELVKQALEDDLSQYPSLDAVTQQAIVEKYRDLHQKIKNEGYYNCQYWEYAKEMGRYLCIFTAFLIALKSGWFITSAALLGLFWV